MTKLRKLYSGNDQTDCAVSILNNTNRVQVWKHWMGENIQYKVDGWDTVNGISTTLVSAAILHSYTTGVQSNPHTVPLSNGGSVIVWTSSNQVSGTSLDDIYGCILDSSGTRTLCDFLINQNTTGTQTRPRLAKLSNGFIVVWESNHTGSYNIYARIYDQTGTAQTSEFQVNSNSGRSHQYPDVNTLVSSSPNNVIVVVWQSDIRNGAVDSNDFDIYFRIFNDGTPASSDTIVNLTLDNKQQNARIAGLSNGNFAVTWQSYSSTNLDDIYFRIFDSTGAQVVTETIVNTSTANTQRNPNIAGFSQAFVITWSTNHAAGGTNWKAFKRNFTNLGVALITETALITSSNIQEATNIAVFGNNNLNHIITWQEGCTTPGCYFCQFSNVNTRPTCTNTSIVISFGITGNSINLSSGMSDSEDSISNMKIKVYAISATYGTVKIGGVALTTGSKIANLSEVTIDSPITAPTTASTSMSFYAMDSLYMTSTSLCTVTLFVCYQTCGTCTATGTSSTDHKCTSCKTGFYPDATNTAMCYNSSTVPSNYYFNTSDNKYYKCYSLCATCNTGGTASVNNCLTCTTNYYPVDQTTNCALSTSPPTGYYFDSTLLKHFFNNLPTCNNFSVSGYTNQNFAISFTNQISDVEDTFSALMIVFKSNPTSGTLKCSGSVLPLNSACNNQMVNYTPPAVAGTYSFNYRARDSKFTVKAESAADCTITMTITVPPVCFTSCATCTTSGTSTDHKCTTCATNYYPLSNNTSQCFTTAAPPVNYWFNTNQFKPCFSSCQSCSADGTSTTHNCLTCINGYYFILSTTNCVNSTPANYYLNTGTSQYKPCFSSCDTCSADGDSINNNCVTCKSGYYQLSDKSSNCANSTPQFYYLNTSTQKYTPCYTSCGTCNVDGTTADHKCLTCKTNNYQQETTNNCFISTDTVSGYYFNSSSSLFKACPASCSQCSSATTCSACNTGYSLNSSTNFCDACYNSCSACSGLGSSADHKCSTCKANYYLQNGTNNCYLSTDTITGHFFDSSATKFMPCSSVNIYLKKIFKFRIALLVLQVAVVHVAPDIL
jgi:hypothetical protein